MLFNSYEFIFLYLPIVFLGFFRIALSSHRLAALWLAASSLFFYGWWNHKFVLLLLCSISFNYAMGYAIGHTRAFRQKAKLGNMLLVTAIAANLGLLGYFKYVNFFLATANQIANSSWYLPDIVLPLGISFFTFTQIAFLVDTYRGIAREYNFIHYLLFVTYFPHLIAGPVLHHKQMMPQFGHDDTYRYNVKNINIGLTIFTLGLFKKVVLADQFAVWANPIFDAVEGGGHPQLVEAWVGALAYTLQLYFDFSGYSDMAIGLSRMFNVKLPINFNSPYKAGNIIEFWRRWHMTLSAFLRDYLYIPLGGNRDGLLRRYLNVIVTMLLGGLWHGANWTFVVWGLLHGIYLVINHAWHEVRAKIGLPPFPGSGYLSVAITFLAVVVAWVLFRAASLAAAIEMLAGMAGIHGISLPPSLESHLSALSSLGVQFTGAFPLTGLLVVKVSVWLVVGLAIVWLLPNTYQWVYGAGNENRPSSICLFDRFSWRPVRTFAVIVGAALALSVILISRESQFLYFQF
jgi:alginate O-acetyltransferase complex protein AlgI